MAKRPPSYTELVYEVLRESPEPLTSNEILVRVEELRPVTTRSPIGTIRTVLSQGRTLVRVPGGRYGYLPNLIDGSVVRLPLTEQKPANHPLLYPWEVHLALFPLSFEQRLRKDRTPARGTLPGGEEVLLPLEHLGLGVWGVRMPEGLRRFLVSQRAAAGDALLVRVVDAVARRYVLDWEPRRKRDEAAIAARNRELAEAATEVLRRQRAASVELMVATTLLGAGAYGADVPPDTLDEVLGQDPRIRRQGVLGWAYVEGMSTEDLEAFDAEGRRIDEILLPDRGDDDDAPTDPLTGLIAGLRATIEDLGPSEIVQEALRRLDADDLRNWPGRPPLDRAQDLVQDAWYLENRKDRVRLAREALRISPDCADAYLLLAAEARTLRQQADLYAQGVAAGERALGPGGVEGYGGVFWGNLLTRPYMRARASLAETLWELGERDEAIGHAQDMVLLNPGDNQGLRYIVLGWLLAERRDEEAGALLDAYDEDWAAWLYGAALVAYRREGDGDGAREALDAALRGNPHVPDYLLGRRAVPDELPDHYGQGDEREAQLVAYGQMEAWRETGGAVRWLARRTG